MGIAGGSIGLSNIQQENQTPAASEPSGAEDDLIAKLEKLKAALDAGLIEQSDFDAAKAKLLGI